MSTELTVRSCGTARTLRYRLRCAGAEHLWACVTEPVVISEWFEDCRRVAPAAYRLTFREQDSTAYTKTVEIQDCRAGRYAATWLEPDAHPSSLVVEHDGDGLCLTHTEVPAELFHGYRVGWTRYLWALVSYLEANPAGPGPGPVQTDDREDEP